MHYRSRTDGWLEGWPLFRWASLQQFLLLEQNLQTPFCLPPARAVPNFQEVEPRLKSPKSERIVKYSRERQLRLEMEGVATLRWKERVRRDVTSAMNKNRANSVQNFLSLSSIFKTKLVLLFLLHSLLRQLGTSLFLCLFIFYVCLLSLVPMFKIAF